MQEAPEREAEEAKREAAWAAENKEKNDEALRTMRAFLPTDIRMLTNEQVSRRVATSAGARACACPHPGCHVNSTPSSARTNPPLLARLAASSLPRWLPPGNCIHSA